MVVMAKVTKSGMKISEASDTLGPRYQQTLRIAKRYGAEGMAGLGIAILGAHSPQAKAARGCGPCGVGGTKGNRLPRRVTSKEKNVTFLKES